MLSRPCAPNLPLGRSRLLRMLGDEKLIELVREGNDAAFEALVHRYEGKLFGFCRHMLRSDEDAEDVMQDVLARAYRGLRAHDREIAARPWLYRIARNCCLDHLGRSRPGQEQIDELEIEGALGTAADQVEQRERLEQVIADIQELPENQRTALTMRELGDLSYEQVANAMETTVPAIKSLLVRARMSLAEAAEARAMPCGDARAEIENGRRLSGAIRRHADVCELCGAAARRSRRRPAAAALLPLLPIGVMRRAAELLGITPGAGGDAVTNGLAGAKVAVIAGAAIATAAPQVAHHVHHAHRAPLAQAAAAPAPAQVRTATVPRPAPPVSRPQAQPVRPAASTAPAQPVERPAATDPAAEPAPPVDSPGAGRSPQPETGASPAPTSGADAGDGAAAPVTATQGTQTSPPDPASATG
ncbi:MAG: sigma-70 family RNA polymerase sigma factor [Thermoleophilaceae bacterium]